VTEDRGDGVAETRVRDLYQRVLSVEIRFQVDDVGSADGISALVVVEVVRAGQEDRGHDFVANVAGRVGVVCVLQFFQFVSQCFFFAEGGVGSAFCGGGWEEGGNCGAEAG